MFEKIYQRSKIKTIYVSDKFDTSKVEESEEMFLNAEHLIGGNGTKYNEDKIDKEYARIDKEGTPGYFTDILDKYVEGTYIKNIKVKTTVKELKEHNWLKSFNWKDLYLGKMVAPFKPSQNFEENYKLRACSHAPQFEFDEILVDNYGFGTQFGVFFAISSAFSIAAAVSPSSQLVS